MSVEKDPCGVNSLETLLNPKISRRLLMLGTAAAAAGATLGRWVPSAQAAVGGDLDIMTWEGYSLQTEAADWIKASGVLPQGA
ncbi:hypothetical protein D3C80_1427290 [compost metagenome]